MKIISFMMAGCCGIMAVMVWTGAATPDPLSTGVIYVALGLAYATIASGK